MYAGSKYESHYTVWTAWISIRVRVRVRVYFILKNLAPPGTTVHVPTAALSPNSRDVIGLVSRFGSIIVKCRPIGVYGI